jgi:hypothetical protein
MNKEA